MNGVQIRCCRCKGRKKLYKMNNGYTNINMGAPLVDCPMCLGTGIIKPLEYAKEEIKEEARKITESYEEANKIYQESKEIYDECLGKNQEEYEVINENTAEKVKKKGKKAKDAEKIVKEP